MKNPTSQGGLRVHAPTSERPADKHKLVVEGLSAFYGQTKVLDDVSMPIHYRRVTGIIGPTGSGKSTFVRCLCRMHETEEGARSTGSVFLEGRNIFGARVDPVEVRRRIQLVQSEPLLFPSMSVRDNVLAGHLLGGKLPSDADSRVETVLQKTSLWDDLRDRLDEPCVGLSRSIRVRLCIARSLALDPEVLVLDEPSQHLDPVATSQIEELFRELHEEYTLVVVTQSLQQAARISDYTAFFSRGELVEFDESDLLFTRPSDPRTEDYITGRVG